MKSVYCRRRSQWPDAWDLEQGNFSTQSAEFFQNQSQLLFWGRSSFSELVETIARKHFEILNRLMLEFSKTIRNTNLWDFTILRASRQCKYLSKILPRIVDRSDPSLCSLLFTARNYFTCNPECALVMNGMTSSDWIVLPSWTTEDAQWWWAFARVCTTKVRAHEQRFRKKNNFTCS
jgi:hypothetical protein